MIIFGTKGRITRANWDKIIEKACPGCGEDLEPQDLKEWFTLYFIPIFPFRTIDSFYKCTKCEQTYKKEIKEMLCKHGKDRKKIEEEGKKQFFITLATCMTHMAKIDGKVSKEEESEIKKLAEKQPKYKNEIYKAIERVKKAKTDDEVFSMLQQARNVLTAEGIMLIIAQVIKILLADGKIDKKEEELLKKYLLVCGIPEGLYKDLIGKFKKGKQN